MTFASADPDEVSPAVAAFFETEVRPLLAEKCLSCHGDDKSPKGGLRLTSRASIIQGGDSGTAAVSGKPDESLLVQAVRYSEDPKMPPKEKLKDREIDALSRWVAMGLPWPGPKSTTEATAHDSAERRFTEKQRGFWSFKPIKVGPIPEVHDKSWARSPIDRFILSALEERGFHPSAPADRRTLIRRATFDLIGLPPSTREVEAFLADDSPDAFARVVDRLLASPHYGERWGRHWLDLVRYADARDLIQLPPESDFREAWRYRDWVVASFNRDLPYPQFLRDQIAGDLVPPAAPGGINADGLVATGMLAIADFVPGDVDKDQMIADYVNDQIDVVGRTFLGLSLACARCHDHKFDPISTEDYYALAGIFFSTRLVPGPVPGNTPLVRVPLLPEDELTQIKAQESADTRRRAELERTIGDASDREYLDLLRHSLVKDLASYLVAACEHRANPRKTEAAELTSLASRKGLHEKTLAAWADYLARVESQPLVPHHPTIRNAATGRLTGATLERSAQELQTAVIERATRAEPTASSLAQSLLMRFRADDPSLIIDGSGRVSLWPNCSGLPSDAKSINKDEGPTKVEVAIEGNNKPVIRFDGKVQLAAPRQVPATGSLFVVFRADDLATSGQRLVGWEDSDVGQHGVGLMPDPKGPFRAVLRNAGKPGDLVDDAHSKGFEVACVTWGEGGMTLHRKGKTVVQKGIESVSSDPNIKALHIGGPGSGGGPRFRGDIAEIRVYDRPLDDPERKLVEAELHQTWFKPSDPNATRPDLVANSLDKLISPRGPFWIPAEQRGGLLPESSLARIDALNRELDALKKKRPREIPQAVVVQDGGPPGTRHEGFKDSPVYLRGNPKRTGKTVPRGFPRVLTAERREPITEGSGRRQLADWLGSPGHPLTARVMVNRIWQHHFGEGLVRTPNDFGSRGETPTHAGLLDYLAHQFVDSGWSTKSMHRLIMLSSAYQQSGRADANLVTADPENRLLGRFTRRRLDAESIRDSLLSVGGRLDPTRGGPAFLELGIPRRTLYLSAARTGASTSDFGRLFDRADPGSIVDRRGQSVVVPQALFFMNDPFTAEQARALAARVAREEPGDDRARLQRLYAIALSRPPTQSEVELGLRLLATDRDDHSWERFALILLCSNDFIYID